MARVRVYALIIFSLLLGGCSVFGTIDPQTGVYKVKSYIGRFGDMYYSSATIPVNGYTPDDFIYMELVAFPKGNVVDTTDVSIMIRTLSYVWYFVEQVQLDHDSGYILIKNPTADRYISGKYCNESYVLKLNAEQWRDLLNTKRLAVSLYGTRRSRNYISDKGLKIIRDFVRSVTVGPLIIE